MAVGMGKRWFNGRLAAWGVAACLVISGGLLPSCGRAPSGTPAALPEAETDWPYDDAAFDIPLPDLASADGFTLEGHQLVAGNDILELHFNPETTGIVVRDRRNGALWHSHVSDSLLPSDGLNRFLKDSFQSLLVLRYVELNLNNLTTKIEAVRTNEPEVAVMGIEDGLRIRYDMPGIGVRLVLELALRGDALVATIPADGLQEQVGNAEWLDKRLTVIREFMDLLDSLLSEMRKESSLRRIRPRVNQAIRLYAELGQLVGSIRDARGLEDIATRSGNIAGQIAVQIRGGSGITGLRQLVETAEGVPEDVRDRILASIKELDARLNTFTILVAQLKTLRAASLVGIDILPYFGAAGDTDEGYMLFPDGSGAIARFKEDRPVFMNDYFSADVYSDREVDLDWERVREDAGMLRTYLPAFGVRRNGQAYLATVSGGEAYSTINYYPSGYLVGLNRSFAGFYLRNIVETASSAGIYTGFSGRRYEDKTLPVDKQVTYLFLETEQADYSGMANRYRDYLMERDLLRKSPLATDEPPVILDLLMGMTEDRLLVDRFIPMTTFDDAAGMLEELHALGAGPIVLNLHGWTSDGFDRYPSSGRPAARLGGEAGLQALLATAARTGTRVYLQDNYLEAYNRIRRVDNSQLAFGSDGRIYRNTSLTINIHSPVRLLERLRTSIFPRMAPYAPDGITYDRMATFLFHDYQEDRTYQRADNLGLYQEMLALSRDTFGGAAVVGGNLYAMGLADFALAIPEGSTRYLYADESVPFCQMLLHGNILYTADMVNQFYDPARQTLKMLEYGSTPYFMLTNLHPSELRHTGYDVLFSSRFEEWKETVASVQAMYRDRLAAVGSAHMTAHQRLSKTLVRIGYSNGTWLYLNYGDQPAEVDGLVVPPADFAVVEGA